MKLPCKIRLVGTFLVKQYNVSKGYVTLVSEGPHSYAEFRVQCKMIPICIGWGYKHPSHLPFVGSNSWVKPSQGTLFLDQFTGMADIILDEYYRDCGMYEVYLHKNKDQVPMECHSEKEDPVFFDRISKHSFKGIDFLGTCLYLVQVRKHRSNKKTWVYTQFIKENIDSRIRASTESREYFVVVKSVDGYEYLVPYQHVEFI